MGELIEKYLEYKTLEEKLNKTLSGELKAIAERALFRESDVHSTVRRFFEVLKPFSHKKTVIPWYYDNHWHECYCVVVAKDLTSGFGSHVSEKRMRGYFMNDEDFFRAIVEVGDKIAEVVRKPIRDAVSKLAELTRELKIPEKTYVVLEGEFRVFIESSKRYVTFRKLKVCSEYPGRLTFMKPIEWRWDKDIELRKGILPIEDVYDDVKRALLELEQRVADAKKHNEEIFRQMREIVAPYALANNL